MMNSVHKKAKSVEKVSKGKYNCITCKTELFLKEDSINPEKAFSSAMMSDDIGIVFIKSIGDLKTVKIPDDIMERVMSTAQDMPQDSDSIYGKGKTDPGENYTVSCKG